METTLTQLVQQLTIEAQVGCRWIACKQSYARRMHTRGMPVRPLSPIELHNLSACLAEIIQSPLCPPQVRALEQQRGLHLSSTELLANSLGRLAAGVQQLEQGLSSAASPEPSSAAAGACGAPADAADGSSSLGASRARAGPALPSLMLFAGRRSSSRRYLLLQNWCGLLGG